jgi:uncharacterized membrane protein YkvA (DUF1232 family)
MNALADLAHKIRVDTHAVWLAARDKDVPFPVRLFGMMLAAYALSPIDLIPDFIPIIGLLDDAIILPVGLWLFLKMLPDGLFEKHRATAEEASARPVSIAGAFAVAAIWVAALSLIGFAIWAGQFY